MLYVYKENQPMNTYISIDHTIKRYAVPIKVMFL